MKEKTIFLLIMLVPIPAHAANGLPSLPTPCTACTPANSTVSATTKFVTAGSATASTSGNTMTITQSSPTAILNWQNFNIDKGYTVNFVQPSSTASALNRIWDANPTTIAGNLNANGQIYLINQNGIVFANGARVNVNGLIASSLDIQDAIYEKGYLSNYDSPNTSNPAFSGTGGFVKVDTGAQLNGSRIMMFAPIVENSGTINTTDGQAVLAAGTSVYLEASQDPNLRGVLVEVDVANPGTTDSNAAARGVQNNTTGTVSNLGSMLSQRGNTTLVGFAVNQQGVISATTSVTENGSIKLLARHEVAPAGSTTYNKSQANAGNSYYYDIRATQTGNVTLGKNSVTEVLPEIADNSTTTDSQGFNPSIIEVMGKTVDVQGKIIVPGGKVNLVAVGSISPVVGANVGVSGTYIYQEIDPKLPYSSFLNPNYIPVTPPIPDGSSVVLESGSLVDVSGSSTSVSVARNILAVQLRGTELADSPLQRNGFLHGQTVYIDIRKGTTLANYSGEEAQIGRTVAERTAAGGQVSVYSTGSAILNPGSTVNISGGQVNYTGSLINTTTLISNGAPYDISNAPADLSYQAIGGMVSVNHSKWGVTQSWTTMGGGSHVWDPGYVQGMSAGSVNIIAPNAAVQGKIVSNTVVGIYQRQPFVDPSTLAVNDYMNTWQMLPKGGSLVIGQDNAGSNDYVTSSDVVVQPGSAPITYSAGATLPSTITLDPALLSSGIDNLAIYTNGKATIASGTSLNLATGGSVILHGNQVDMLGSIDVPGGTVALTTSAAGANTQAGAITVAGNISTRGAWVNDSKVLGPPNLATPIVENGGKISIDSGADLSISSGVSLDASGGGYVDQSGKVHGGNGGNMSISGTIQSLDGVALRSYGVDTGKGGALSVSTTQDVILGTGSMALVLPASFFRTGGFSSYSISGNANITVSDNTLIAPRSQSLILASDASLQPSGTDVYAISSSGFLPDWSRSPASIYLKQNGIGGGTLQISQGASIVTDPGASINLDAGGQMTISGTLDAPAGNISLTMEADTTYLDTQSIVLDSGGQLLTRGYFLRSAPNANGLIQGQVLSGGHIDVAANGGFFYAKTGSLVDVSGTSANIDLLAMNSGKLTYANTHVAGDAGSISVTAAEAAIFDGSMNGSVESGSQAAAGSFSLDLTSNYDPTSGTFPTSLRQIQVMPGAGTFGSTAVRADKNNVYHLVSDGQAYVAPNSLKGFDRVSLALRKGQTDANFAIVLADNVSLSARRSITLDAPLIDVGAHDSLNSAHVTLGNLDQRNQVSVPPAAGTGSLNVTAQLVDISGKLSIGNANSIDIASSGDIRLIGVDDTTAVQDAGSLQGTLQTQADITLKANQVYTSTLAQFSISSPGTITILPNDASDPASGSSPVLSAGGSLTLSAANIYQDGVLKAPMGTIALDGTGKVVLNPGSLTSVSSEGQTVPFGFIQGGNGWYYDLTGNGSYLVPITTAPQKIVKLEGPDVSVSKGAAVDLSGGGDLFATEFFAGIGGTTNVLDPTEAPANTYAIVPGISGYMPYDPQSVGQYAQSGSKTVLKSDGMVYLSGGNGLPAGYYSLLPASYALLPGAYRVTAVSGYRDMQPGLGALTLPDGSQIIAGKFAVAGTNIMAARWSGFEVSSGAIVRTQSEFHDSTANAFFAAQAASAGTVTPPLPVDAGQLIVDATGSSLSLDGSFITAAGTGGRGAMVDLNGPAFDIVNAAGTGTSGGVELTTQTLSDLGAQSILIGGVRTQESNGVSISVGANSVVVENSDAALSAPEIILASNDTLTVKSGSVIQGSGNYAGQPQNISISGDGALLRVSSGSQVSVTRSNVAGSQGTLSVENGASITSSNSVLLDATNSTSIGDTAILTGKAFSVAASGIDMGNGSSGATALSLSASLLSQMSVFQDIVLHSYGDINFYSGASLGGLDSKGNHLIQNLTLDAQSLNGNDSSTSTIDASTVTFKNSNGGSSSSPTGTGTLNVTADNLVLSDGASNIGGFDNVNLDASRTIATQGTGSLNLSSASQDAHSLVISGAIMGAAKSDQGILASGYDITLKSSAPASDTDVGAKLTISGKTIADQGSIVLSSGSLTLHAANDLNLDTGSSTSAAGTAKSIAGQTVYASGGTVTLISDSGNVSINSGAVVDVSGNGGDAGTLTVNAVNGSFSANGMLKGSGASVQGSFVLDTGTLASLDSLGSLLSSGGFTNSIDMRVRNGDVSLGGVVKASSFHLSADNGNVSVSGTIDASGSSGGDILLAAKSDVTLQSSAVLDASATSSDGNGGKVNLETVNGNISLGNTSPINASGAAQGSVLLRAPQNNSASDVAVNGRVNVSSGANVTVEGYRNYNTSGSITVGTYTDPVTGNSTPTVMGTDAASDTSIYTDAQAFVANAGAIESRLGMSGSNMQVLPGVQITSIGDMTLATNWDLSQWRFSENGGNVPGILTLKAGGNLDFGSTGAIASLSDGFTSATSSTLTNDSSWSYRLVAGSDSSAANVMAVNDLAGTNSGNVVLASGSEIPRNARGPAKYTLEMVRTGTGSIDIAAGGGLYLGNRDSVIYTAGGQASGIPSNIGAAKAFTTGGGDININVKGDINAVYGDGSTPGSATNQLITDWQWRQGNGGSVPSAWWINFGTFAQGIGALGGGDISISAGGDITSLSAVVPTTGYVDSSGVHTLGGGNLAVKAGGNIDSGIFYVGNGQGNIQAGGSLDSSRQDLTANVTLYTILALGQGNIDVKANGDLNIQTVVNPTMIFGGPDQYAVAARGSSLPVFSTYAGNSSVSLASLNGNVLLSNDTSFLHTAFNSGSAAPYILQGGTDPGAITLYPGTLNVAALNGSIDVNSSSSYSMVLFPAQYGNLSLLAGSDINFAGQFYMSDVTPAPLQPTSPVSSYGNVNLINGHVSSPSTATLHSGDTVPIVISAGGNINGDNSSPQNPDITLPKSAQIQAGGDIVNFSASIQNLTANDTTSFIAGRDILYTPNPGNAAQPTVGVTLYGPGQLFVQAGRNVDLGQSAGLLTDGNLVNPYLPAQGAFITVLAGVGGSGMDTQSFIGKYIDPASGNSKYSQDLPSYISANIDPSKGTGKDNFPYLVSYFFDPSTATGQANASTLASFAQQNGASSKLTPAEYFTYFKTLPDSVQQNFAYSFFGSQSAQVQAAYVASVPMQTNLPDLISFVNSHGGNASTATDAYTYFQGMASELQNQFVNQVFFNVLRTSGRSGSTSGDYQAGYDAISTLFPGSSQGDLSLYYSQIKTVRGGDINIFTPGGGVNAGLANTSPNGPQKTPDQLGVVTVDGGSVNAFVNNDFQVNQSRVFTLQGGDIMMWSSHGNLDAGKGSKSVSSTPPPILVVDPQTGTFSFDVTQSVAGSGIRVLLANSNVVPGSVDLFAPAGVINAGDAGIGSAGNIYLGAQQVIGASNINFGGVATGIPSTATASFGGLAGISNFQGAAQAADQATGSLGNQADDSAIKKALENFKPLFISVDVIGLGGLP